MAKQIGVDFASLQNWKGRRNHAVSDIKRLIRARRFIEEGDRRKADHLATVRIPGTSPKAH